MGLGCSPNGNEIGSPVLASAMLAISLPSPFPAKSVFPPREPGTLTLQDVAKDGRVLITRDVPRVGMGRMTAGSVKERDLSWLDWSAPKDLSLDGKQLFVPHRIRRAPR